MRIRFLSSAFALLGLVTAVGTAQAQTGTVAGRVTQEGGTTPIPGAQVQILSGTTRVAMGASSDDGNFRVGTVPAGTYTVVVSRIGFTQKRVDGVRVTAGATTTLNVSMQELAAQLNQVVTTGTRGAEPEKILDSPNAISVVTSERIAERPAASIVDHIKAVPGLSISNGGIVQANIVSRGFNNAFSTSMLMLQDYRFAGVPSLRVNVPFLFTGTGDDIDRIEVLQGPASALYGPNSGAGVLHVITKSPFTSKGSQITLDGGERSLARVGVRHAGTIGNAFGYKFSGEYFTAQDWEYTDPNELTPREWGRTATGALNPAVPAARQGVAKFRDYGLEKYSGEARFDYRPSDNTEAITTVGYSNVASATEITGTFGAAQVRNWSYLNLQQRFRHKKFFAQVFYNGSNAGNDNAGDDQGTFYLRTGIPVVDNSSVLVGQLQQGFSLGATKFTAGADYIATNPVTEGTIMGRNEDDDNITEMGGYLQFTRPLSEKLEFTGAVRGDMNSRIDGTQFSPRAAFVYKATPTQNWRLTYNRAFNSPASFSFFLDQYSGNTPAPGMPVQVFGNPPKTGWQYSRACTTAINGGLCMRSPYAAGEVDATGASSWIGFTAALPTIIAGLPVSSLGSEANRTALLGLLAGPVGTIVRGLRPTASQVPSIMLNLATRQPVLNPATVRDLPPLGANFSNTFELGYKGVFNNNLRLAVDFWYQIRPAEPATQLVNPGVVMVQTNLQSYLTTALTAALTGAGVPNATATATAAAGALAPLMAAIPQGAIAFNNPLYDQPYLVFTYQNAAGQVDVRGFDVALDYLFNDTFSMSATYSNLNRNVWNDAPNASAANPLTANAAKHRGTLTFRSDNQSTGRTAEVRMRYTGPFPVNSGVYNSYNVGTPVPYDAVPENLFLDAGISLKLPIAANARWSLNGQNLLDRKTPSFIGVPAVGRMVTTRISYTF